MLEAFGDLWEMQGDLYCILTNGVRNSRGENVMGGGVAKEAKDRYPGIPKAIGDSLSTGRFGFLYLGKWFDEQGVKRELAAFPTKTHWMSKSDLDLVVRSAQELMAFVRACEFERVLLPRPGCGLGGLSWEDEVRPALAPILDDRVVAVGRAAEAPVAG